MEGLKMNLMKMYEENEDFKEYVDKVMAKHDYSLEKVLELKLVQEYADYLMKK